ncbi:MAG: hypothetical protein R2726_16045 [Acidimicrobiales bacterium]
MSVTKIARRAALVVATVLVLAGCTPLLMVGDSITVGTSSYVEPKLSDGGFVATIDGRVGRPTDEVLQVIRAKKGDTEYFVVETGYNDAGDPALFRTRFQAIVNELAGAKKVVVVTLTESRSYYVTANQTIRALVAGRPNFVIADWAFLVNFVPGALQSDGIHLTPAGSAALAQLIADTVGPEPS